MISHLRACLLLVAVLIPAFARAADKPNILFIFTDDHATSTIGAYNE